MADNSRVRPLISTSKVWGSPHSALVRPLPYEGDATLYVITSDVNHCGWITHPDNAAVLATLTTTSADSLYVKANMQAVPASSTWRSTSLATQDIAIDFGVGGASVDILALINHNLSSAATVTIVAGTTTGYLDFSSSMTWREFTVFKWLSMPQVYRYWRIRIADAANTDGFMEIGYLVAGLLTKPGYTFRQGWTSATEIGTAKVVTEFGTPYVEEMFRRQRLGMEFGPLNAQEIYLLRRWYTTARKNTYPALLLPVRNGSDAYFGRLQNMFEERAELHSYVDLDFVEDSIGVRLEA